MSKENLIRQHAEHAFIKELQYLEQYDEGPKPENWKLSPRSVVQYVAGGTMADGFEIQAKYFGNRRLIELAVATLVTDRALLLTGIPGTAKTWLSEHMAAAISGDSTLVVQGTAGTAEDAIRYGWNYARLLSEGPSEAALVPSPVMRAMQSGKIVRVEELSRMPAEVQDALITILSEKTLSIPELGQEIQAVKGFNLIATANSRDQGVNELSSALKRRFNSVVMPLPETLEEEVHIVQTRVAQLGESLQLPAGAETAAEAIKTLVTIFRELRSGKTADGKLKVKSPGSTLSPAEAISVITNGQALAAYFGDGTIRPRDIAAGLQGAIIKDPRQDTLIWSEYLETIVRERKGWEEYYQAATELLK